MITITGALIGVAVSFAALALAVLGLVLRIGKLIGKLESGMVQNKQDISALWEHQRNQDNKISYRMLQYKNYNPFSKRDGSG